MSGRRWWGSVILMALIFLGVFPAQARGMSSQGNLRFEHLTVEDGLPHATVLGVLQDRQGFMWFATSDGLSRYDGREFKNFQHDRNNPNSLSNNNTFSLIESSDGLIWVGTDPGGLDAYNPATGNFKHYVHAEDDPNSLANNSVWSLMEDRDGNIWVGTRAGLSRLDRESGLFTNYLPDADDPRSLAAPVVYRIYEDSAGTIWIGGNRGLQRYDPETDDFTTFTHDPEDETSLTSNDVWAMLEDSAGNFWVGTHRAGLNLFDRETGTIIRRFYHDDHDSTTLSDDNVWNLFEDSKGNLWVLTEYAGINRYDPVADAFVSYQHNPNDPSTISHNDVFWMTEDRSGVLWITTRYGGVNKLYDGLSQFGLYRGVPEDENTLNSNEVYSVLADEDGVVWFGTFGGGLNRLDRRTGKMTFYMHDPNDPASLSNDKVYYLHRGADGSLWVATYGGGLNRLNERTGKFTVYTNTEETPYGISIKYPTTLENAKDGKLWVGTLGFGLLLFNPKTAEIEATYEPDDADDSSMSEGTVYDLAYDQQGHLWIATARGGLEMFDPETGVFTHHVNNQDDEQSVLSNTVHALYWDGDSQTIWAATAGGLSGLNEKTGMWTNLTKKDGLPSDTLTGIQPGLGNTLWVSSTKGISCINFDTESIVNYSAADGLQGDQFQIASSHLGPNGEIFFGGSNGVTHFLPQQLERNQYLPKTVFTGFYLNNKLIEAGSDILPVPIEKTSTITLTYEQKNFSFEFAALSYQLPSKNLYRYKLEGFDTDWSPPSTDNRARYTNIEPGMYTFKVLASNNDGVWNPVEAKIDVYVLPPWWESLWFRVLAGFGLVVLTFGIVQYRTRSIKRRNRELERRVAERTDELETAHSELEMKLKEVNSLQVQLKEQAIRDPLTGLYNRRYLHQVLEKEVPRASREGTHLLFMLLDLDHFKNINDTYGHAGGDKALTTLSDLLVHYTRANDYAFRYGGEEFMLLLTNIDIEDGYQRAEELRQAVHALKIEHEDLPIRISTSIGIASYPQHGDHANALLLAMDDALYQAKHRGRDRVEIFTKAA